jgi:hypothetical protein
MFQTGNEKQTRDKSAVAMFYRVYPFLLLCNDLKASVEWRARDQDEQSWGLIYIFNCE